MCQPNEPINTDENETTEPVLTPADETATPTE